MKETNIAVKHLVLLGGGHAHVQTVKMFAMKPLLGVSVTLISRDVDSPYSGMIPGFVAGYYTRDECHIDLRRLCSFASVKFIHTEASSLDVHKKQIFCKDGRPPISYDVLSIDIGITPKALPHIFDHPGGACITPVKPIDGFARRFDVIIRRVLSAPLGKATRLAVVGGGAGGTELSFMMQHRLRDELEKAGKDPNSLSVMLFNRGSILMQEHGSTIQNIVKRLVAEKGIVYVPNCEIVSVASVSTPNSNGDVDKEDFLVAADGRRFAFDEAIWCTQATAQSWLKDAGLETTADGFVCVQKTLESTNVPDVFAAGDIAHLVDNPRPKAGVFAVRAGPPLTANLRHRLLGEPLDPWTPQEQFLGILGTGGGSAIASKGPLGLEGKYLWKLKDRIDRVFMAAFQQLPNMEEMAELKLKTEAAARIDPSAGGQNKRRQSEDDDDGDDDYRDDAKKLKTEGGSGAVVPVLTATRTMDQDVAELFEKAKMRCGGCGSKVGASTLSRVLDRVKDLLVDREEVVYGIAGQTGDDAALIIPPASPAYSVHTIDYFRSFVSDPYVFGQIAANHALSDVYAMNGDPVSALALAVVPFGPERMVEESLVQMMGGCLSILKREGCALVGGHTSEGTEAAMGLSVNGTVHPDKVLHKGPCEAGHVLILTKPLGTGALMAADMRAKARGPWIENAFQSMLLSNREAARILHKYRCSACTDVTGFGLMGHLLEMLKYGETTSDSSACSTNRCSALPSRGRVVAKLRLDAVPVLDGAVECVSAGIVSSLQPANIRSARAIGNPEDGENHRSYQLLFDPQTSGGLLAAVPREAATTVIDELRQAGFIQSAVIGAVIAASTLAEQQVRLVASSGDPVHILFES